MKKMSDYIDEYGLICQVMGDSIFDGGDSAQRVGMLGIAASLNDGFRGEADLEMTKEFALVATNTMISKLQLPSGKLVRHPDYTKWYSNPNHFSRDQQSAVVIAAGFSGNQALVLNLMKQHLKRFGAYQNFGFNRIDVDGNKKFITGDIASPEHFNLYFRALNLYILYPLLLIGDLFTLLNSLIIIYKSYIDPDDTSNDLNHICVLLQSKKVMPTPISWLARKLYRRFRKNAGPSNDNRLPGFGPQSALDYYFADKISSSPPINELFRNFLEKEL